jgi:hypothetical protein
MYNSKEKITFFYLDHECELIDCLQSSIRLRDIESKFQQQAAEIDQTVATRVRFCIFVVISIHFQSSFVLLIGKQLEALVQASSIHLQELTVQSADRERTIEELKAQLSASDAIRNMEQVLFSFFRLFESIFFCVYLLIHLFALYQAAHLSVMRAHDSTVTELEAKWQSMELKLALAVDQGTRSAASAVEYQACFPIALLAHEFHFWLWS